MSFLKPFWKSNQRAHVSITLLGSQRKAYFNFLSPLQTRMIRMLKSTSRHKPLRDSCRAPNLLQIAYLDLLIDRPRTKVHLNKQQLFCHIFLPPGKENSEISTKLLFAFASLLVVAESTLNFFSSWAYHSRLFEASLFAFLC